MVCLIQVTESLKKIIAQSPKKDVLAKVFPMIKRLANGEWFTTRVAVCAIFAVTYNLVPEDVQVRSHGSVCLLSCLFNALLATVTVR